MIGFAENRDGKVCAVLAQPFIADARLATKEEIHDEFLRLRQTNVTQRGSRVHYIFLGRLLPHPPLFNLIY